MSHTVSPSAGRRYGVVLVSEEWGVARSSYYAARRSERSAKERVVRRRGPKTPYGDAELLGRIRGVLAASPFVGEGHRKVWARLRMAGG